MRIATSSSRRWRRLLPLLFAVALTACGSGQMDGMGPGESGMPSPMVDASGSTSRALNPADLMFVQMMIPHHEQAVEMSDLLLAKSGVDADVRALAQQIKDAQQPEIEQMKGWLADWGVNASPMAHDHADQMGGMLSEKEIAALAKAEGPAGQKLFLQGMIAHHQGAIEMATNVLAVGADPDVKRLAGSIVTSQQAEIAQMEEMLGR